MADRRSFFATLFAAPLAAVAVWRAPIVRKGVVVRSALHRLLTPRFKKAVRYAWNTPESWLVDPARHVSNARMALNSEGKFYDTYIKEQPMSDEPKPTEEPQPAVPTEESADPSVDFDDEDEDDE